MTTPATELTAPDYWISEDTVRHGMRRCFKTHQQIKSHGDQGVYLGVWTRESVEAEIRKAVVRALAAAPTEPTAEKSSRHSLQSPRESLPLGSDASRGAK